MANLPLSLVGCAGGHKIDPNKRVQLWSGSPMKGTISLDLSKYQVIRVYCAGGNPADYYDIVVGMSTHTTREVGGYNCNTTILTDANGVYASGDFPNYGGVTRVEAYY